MTNLEQNTGGWRDHHWRAVRWALIAGLLTLPWVAMQVTDSVAWTAFDFAAMGALLIGAGLVYELAAWKIRNPLHRGLLAVGIVGLVLLVWAQGAVGIFP